MILQPSVGTELKFLLTIDDFPGVHASSCNFRAVFYVYPGIGEITCSKTASTYVNMKQYSDNSWLCLVDTAGMGAGRLVCRLDVDVPDGDFGTAQSRTELAMIDTTIDLSR